MTDAPTTSAAPSRVGEKTSAAVAPPKIVLAPFGSLGDLHPFMALALRLRDRGYAPVLAASAMYGDKARAEGIPFYPVRPDMADLERLLKLDRAQIVRAVGSGPEFLLRRIVLSFLREGYADIAGAMPGAAAAVVGGWAFAARLAAEVNAVPIVTVALQPAAFLSAFDPPVGLGLPFIPRPRHTLELSYNKLVRAGLMRASRLWARRLERFRTDLGLGRAERNPLFEGHMQAQATLGLYSPLLGSPHPDFPRNTRIVGFADYDRRDDAGSALSDALARFLAVGPPPLVFTLGSFSVHDPGDFYQQSLDAARRLGMRSVLIGAPPAMTGSSTDAITCDYVSYSQVFPRAAAVVHHAGIGTSSNALRSGRPQLAVPVMQDQPDNASRLERLWVAKVIPRPRYSAPTAAAALKLLLDDPQFSRRAKAVRSLAAAEDGASAAVGVIEGVIGSPSMKR
jgi:UDP:flavonoid glycosyltransferase YjiC (YdhE family)